MQMGTVLLYNLEQEKLRRIRFLLVKLGLGAREVSPAEFAHPIGYLAGLEGYEAAQEAAEEPFRQEMLVMAGLTSQQFGAFLEGLRQSRATVALKAVLTETNADWSSHRLQRELAAEHAALQKLRCREAPKKSAHRK